MYTPPEQRGPWITEQGMGGKRGSPLSRTHLCTEELVAMSINILTEKHTKDVPTPPSHQWVASVGTDLTHDLQGDTGRRSRSASPLPAAFLWGSSTLSKEESATSERPRGLWGLRQVRASATGCFSVGIITDRDTGCCSLSSQGRPSAK